MDNQYYSILNKLDRIDKKLDGKYSNKYLSITQVCEFSQLSQSTIRRSVKTGRLKCSKKVGKLLFLESDVRKWLND